MRKTIKVGGRTFKLKEGGVYQFGAYFLTIGESDGWVTIRITSDFARAASVDIRTTARTEKEALVNMNHMLAGGWLGLEWK